MNSIKDRFEQPGYEIYRNLEQLLLKACRREEITSEFDAVCSFYKDDLQPQLLTFGLEFQRMEKEQYGENNRPLPTIFDIREYFTSLTSAKTCLLSQVCTVVKLILVMLATNATSERSFIALCRVKNYLRSTEPE